MALVHSNTYIEETAGTSLNTGRGQRNNTFRSLLTNFKSTSPPVAVNLIASGAGIGEQDGMFYWSATTNALYISDPVHVKSSPVGGNFTRAGIATRIENGIATRIENGIEALAANVATYEIGELVTTVSASPSLVANARLYMITANNGTMADVVDIGVTPGLALSADSNLTSTGLSFTASKLIALSNSITEGNTYINDYVVHNGNTGTYAGFSAVDTFVVATNGSEATRVVANGNFGVNTTSPSERVHVTGNMKASGNLYITDVQSTGNIYTTDVEASGDLNSASDRKFKSNIRTIDSALNKVNKMRGVYFTKDEKESLGVIAQEVEKILPEVVTSREYKSVAYGNIVGVLIEAIKELNNEVEDLRNRTLLQMILNTFRKTKGKKKKLNFRRL